MTSAPPQLRLRFPEGTERTLVIESEPFRIGRRPDNQLVIAEMDISRVQAELRKRGEVWWLEDLGSSFGTSVNGRTVTSTPLRNRDVISLGRDRQFEMVFLHQDQVSRILHEVHSRSRTDTSPDAVRKYGALR